MNSEGRRPIPDLLSDAVTQLAKLISNEFELARAELSGKAGQAGRAVGMIGAGAILLISALVLLLFTIAAGLMHAGLPDWAAYLLTGGVAALISAGLIGIGMSRLSADKLKPTATLEQIEQDRLAAKEMVR